MIDIHSHLLYETDDGSRSLEDSIKLIKKAEENGFDSIILTPHYLENRHTKTKQENLEKMKILQEKLDEKGINIKLYLGNEIYVSENMAANINKEFISTLADSEYVLIEFPMNAEIRYIDEFLEPLIKKGLKIIIAHPERYKYVQENHEYFYDLMEDYDIYIQCNYESIIGEFGKTAKKTFIKLLKDKKVSFMGSDTHTYDIYSNMPKILKKIGKYAKGEYLERITCLNAKNIINK